MKIVQVKLRNENNELLTTWVDFKQSLNVGKYVTLKDFQPYTRWLIEAIYTEQIKDAKDFDWHRKWNNNI